MQLPLDLCRRWGVQDHCNETEEDMGSPVREKGMGDVTPGENPLGGSLLGNQVPYYHPLEEHQATKPRQDGAPADPDVPMD